MKSCNSYPHLGKKYELVAKAGPCKGLKLGHYDCCDTIYVDSSGRTLGRYAVIEVQQKTRVVHKVVWDAEYRRTWSERLAKLPAAERLSRLRKAVLLCPCVLYDERGSSAVCRGAA